MAGEIYREDREGGHTAVVAQLVSGSLARPDLAPGHRRADGAVDRVLRGRDRPGDRRHTGRRARPVRDLAYALMTFYLGVNLLTHLDADSSRTDALFERVAAVAPVLEQLLVRE